MKRTRLFTGKSEGGVLAVLSLCMFTAMLGVGVISPILPLYASMLGASGVVLGAVFSAFSLARIGGLFLSGDLSDRYDRKRLLCAGLAIYAVSSLLYPRAASASLLIGIRFFHGLGSALVVPVAMAIGAELSGSGSEGSVMGSLQGALFVGIGIGPLISGVLTDRFGMAAPFIVMTLLTGGALVLVYAVVPTGLKPIRAQAEDSRRGISVFLQLCRDDVLRWVFFYQFLSAVCRGSMLMMLPMLASGLSLSFSKIGVVVSLNSLATGFLQGYTGRVADKLPRNFLVAAGGIASSCTLFLIPFFGTFEALAAGSVLFGVGHALASPALASMAAMKGKVYGTGHTMGFYDICFTFGMMTGPLFSGMASFSSLSGPFPYLSAIIFIASVPFLSTKRFRSCLAPSYSTNTDTGHRKKEEYPDRSLDAKASPRPEPSQERS